MTVFAYNACNKVVAIYTSVCMLSSSCNREKQFKLYNLQKDVISTQKSLAVKKSGAVFKNGQCEKRGGQEMAVMV